MADEEMSEDCEHISDMPKESNSARELQVGQPHLHPWKGDGAAHPAGHHQASGGKECYQD